MSGLIIRLYISCHKNYLLLNRLSNFGQYGLGNSSKARQKNKCASAGAAPDCWSDSAEIVVVRPLKLFARTSGQLDRVLANSMLS